MKRRLDDAGSDVSPIRPAENQNMLFLAAHQEAHDKGDTMTAIHAQPKSAPRSSYDQATFNTTTEEATPANLATMLGCMYALIVANLVQVHAGFAAADPSPPAAVVPGIAATALLGLGALPMIRSGPSEATVKTHLSRVLAKLGVRDRVQAVIAAFASGIAQATDIP